MKIKKKIIWAITALQIAFFIPVSAAQSGSSTGNSMVAKNIYQMPKLSSSDLKEIGDKIFKNEAGGKKENLVYWNTGEDFPSLGIGHFIWYRQGQKEIFDESFPKLVDFYKANNIKIPKILQDNKYAPWTSRNAFLKDKEAGKTDELRDFLYETRDTQVVFIYKRLEDSLDKMLLQADNKENVRYQFYRVSNSPNGLYALIDYVNFKGEGTAETERYNGKGWGLLQVLENMKGKETGKSAMDEFSASAKFVLERRVKNSDPKRNEAQWLKGWENRTETYKIK
jgi:hypothetical protein